MATVVLVDGGNTNIMSGRGGIGRGRGCGRNSGRGVNDGQAQPPLALGT